MEKMNINEVQAFKFVKEGMELIGYPNNVEIHSYVGDNDNPIFYASYIKECNDKVDRHIKPLRIKDFCDLMEFAMMVNGYDVLGIDIRVRNESICYAINFNLVSYDGVKKSKRRR